MAVTMLNVGCGSSRIPIAGVQEVRLDLNPALKPDIVCDARQLETLPAAQYDGVWCSHVLEHFYEHEVPVVLRGIRHVLKDSGVLFAAVPDLAAMMTEMARRGLGINDVIYVSSMGPVRPRDMLYGFEPQITTGNVFFAHKTGFDNAALVQVVAAAGFNMVYSLCHSLQVDVIACATKLPRWAAKYVNTNDKK